MGDSEILSGLDKGGTAPSSPALSAGTGIPKEISDLAKHSPTLQHAIDTLRAHNVTVKTTTTEGTYFSPSTNTVVLGADGRTVAALIHEAHHAEEHFKNYIDAKTLSREEFLRRRLIEEAEGEALAARARTEFARAGVNEHKETRPGEYQLSMLEFGEQMTWNKAVAEARQRNPKASPAELDEAGYQAVRAGVLQLTQAGKVGASGTGTTHLKNYGAYWDKLHPSPQPSQPSQSPPAPVKPWWKPW
jgi:hypothetical protein